MQYSCTAAHAQLDEQNFMYVCGVLNYTMELRHGEEERNTSSFEEFFPLPILLVRVSYVYCFFYPLHAKKARAVNDL